MREQSHDLFLKYKQDISDFARGIDCNLQLIQRPDMYTIPMERRIGNRNMSLLRQKFSILW